MSFGVADYAASTRARTTVIGGVHKDSVVLTDKDEHATTNNATRTPVRGGGGGHGVLTIKTPRLCGEQLLTIGENRTILRVGERSARKDQTVRESRLCRELSPLNMISRSLRRLSAHPAGK